PVAGREHPDLQDQIGLYVNTVVLRTEMSETDSFGTLLGRVREMTLGAYGHQWYPFEAVVEAVGAVGDRSRSPLFDIMVVLQEEEWVPRLSGLRLSSYPMPGLTSKFDLTFFFSGQEVLLEYNSDCYDEGYAERLCGHLSGLLSSVLERPDEPVLSL